MTYNRENAGAAALVFARQLTGRPYIFGGTWPRSGGTDCSGLVQFAYDSVGVLLPRTTFEQYKLYQLPASAKSEPGDLLFILGSDPLGNEPGHVMMFVADGEVFQAPFTGEKIGQYPYDTNVFEFRTRPALALKPAGPAPTKNPSTTQLTHAGLVLLTGPAQARTAIANGWTIYVWNGIGFSGASGRESKGTPEYANVKFSTPRV